MKKAFIPILLCFYLGISFIANGPLLVLVSLLHFDATIFSHIAYFIVILSYIGIIVTLLLEKDNLQTFNFDRSSLIILVIAGFVRVNLHIPFEIQYKTIIGILSLILLFINIKGWNKLPKSNIRWLLFGILGCVLVFPLSLIESTQIGKYLESNRLYEENFFGYAIKNLLFTISFAAPFEEIIIRGILWGQLRRWNVNENRIMWIQGILFWIMHYRYIFTSPISFFTLPISILLFSLLVRYSKQTFPSIIAHTLVNTLIPIMVMVYSR